MDGTLRYPIADADCDMLPFLLCEKAFGVIQSSGLVQQGEMLHKLWGRCNFGGIPSAHPEDPNLNI